MLGRSEGWLPESEVGQKVFIIVGRYRGEPGVIVNAVWKRVSPSSYVSYPTYRVLLLDPRFKDRVVSLPDGDVLLSREMGDQSQDRVDDLELESSRRRLEPGYFD